MADEPTYITQESYEAALVDPKVHKLWADADAYRKQLIARGHCPAHLVVNCGCPGIAPAAPKPGR